MFTVHSAGILAQLLLEGLPALLVRELFGPEEDQLRRTGTVFVVHLVVHLLHENDLFALLLHQRLSHRLRLANV